MSARLSVRGLPILIAVVLLAAPVLAQPAPPAPSPAAAPGRAHAVVERRIADMRAKLKITPDQAKAFDDFAVVMRANATRMDSLMQEQGPKLATLSAVDQMKSYEEVMQAQADDLQRLVPAFSRLYETLTPAQKQIADETSRQAMTGRRS